MLFLITILLIYFIFQNKYTLPDRIQACYMALNNNIALIRTTYLLFIKPFFNLTAMFSLLLTNQPSRAKCYCCFRLV